MVQKGTDPRTTQETWIPKVLENLHHDPKYSESFSLQHLACFLAKSDSLKSNLFKVQWNAMIFDPDNVPSEPVLDRSRRQADEAIRAYHTLLVV
ncbi:hypothetical protein V6N12_069702 [Hibiscus sabdariffa]|uniref:Uncharacterized protein n=1 Tax=Hibiscus sabdariffa TaxID=183260 RepID=A0ABR2FET8_9ROSI